MRARVAVVLVLFAPGCFDEPTQCVITIRPDTSGQTPVANLTRGEVAGEEPRLVPYLDATAQGRTSSIREKEPDYSAVWDYIAGHNYHFRPFTYEGAPVYVQGACP